MIETDSLVTYTPTGIHGKVKSLCEDGIHAFVVFNCNNEWDNHSDYTGQRCELKELELGWTPKA